MVRSHGASDAGAVRTTNEDAFLADDELALFVVADGMGGHAAGEVASRTAVESIESFVRRSATDGKDSAWPCGTDPSLSPIGNRIRTAIFLANERVARLAAQDDDYAGMGTTVVCVLISDGRVTVGHVGDSRLYSFSSQGLQQQTCDDTWANAVTAAGANRSTLESHPFRHVLTNVVGTPELAAIHVSERELVDGEVLLLCTDGIHGVLDDDTLKALMSRGGDLRERADALIAEAVARGSRDNLTAVLVQYSDEGQRG